MGGFLALSEGLHTQIVSILDLATPLFSGHPVLGALLFVALAAFSAILVFFSGVLLVPAGVQAWGEAGCFILLWCGWFLGGLVTYSVGRRLGRPVVRRMLTDGVIDRYESFVPQQGSFLEVLLIQLVIPSDVSGYFFGLLGYRPRIYFGALVFSELPYALGTVYLSDAFVNRRFWSLLTIAAVLIAVLVWVRLRHRRRPA